MGGTLKHPLTNHRQNGITLVEMLTVMAIIGVLLAIGIPSYRYATNSNRISAEVNALFSDMQFARADAIREGKNVVVCISTDGNTCLGGAGTAWNRGWIVCSDPNSTNTCAGAPAQAVWRYQSGFTSTDTFNADQNTSAVSFNREGFAALANIVTVTLHDATGNSNFTRCLQIDRPGTLTTERAGTGNCT